MISSLELDESAVWRSDDDTFVYSWLENIVTVVLSITLEIVATEDDSGGFRVVSFPADTAVPVVWVVENTEKVLNFVTVEMLEYVELISGDEMRDVVPESRVVPFWTVWVSVVPSEDAGFVSRVVLPRGDTRFELDPEVAPDVPLFLMEFEPVSVPIGLVVAEMEVADKIADVIVLLNPYVSVEVLALRDADVNGVSEMRVEDDELFDSELGWLSSVHVSNRNLLDKIIFSSSSPLVTDEELSATKLVEEVGGGGYP